MTAQIYAGVWISYIGIEFFVSLIGERPDTEDFWANQSSSQIRCAGIALRRANIYKMYIKDV